MTIYILIAALAAAILTWFVTRTAVTSRYNGIIADRDRQLAVDAAQLEAERRLCAEKDAQYRQALADIKNDEERILKAARAELSQQNEEALKSQKEAIETRAKEVMSGITAGFEKDFKDMREAFDRQKSETIRQGQSICTKFEETERRISDNANALGRRADSLANALRDNHKMQGNFGETILENILKKEGMTKGRDYDSEVYLCNKKGERIKNEDTGRMMRPDFILHFPDSTDILLDSKMSLVALSDYCDAETDEQREAASARNLESVNGHIDELVSKEYQRYVVGRNTLDYVIMFIPNYNAWQLAKAKDPDIFGKALEKKVLITTEETLIPFLGLIRSAWVAKAQLEHMEDIVEAARMMLDRVYTFSTAQAKVESDMQTALNNLKKNGKRLIEGPQSIAKAAQKVLDSGVKSKKMGVLPKASDDPQ